MASVARGVGARSDGERMMAEIMAPFTRFSRPPQSFAAKLRGLTNG
jgi:hypothetical protein